mgnify:CR=1 FL=1
MDGVISSRTSSFFMVCREHYLHFLLTTHERTQFHFSVLIRGRNSDNPDPISEDYVVLRAISLGRPSNNCFGLP